MTHPGESRPYQPHPAPVAMSQVARQDELTIGSLCSGYGGLEMGLQAVIGGRVAWHVEYDKHPAAVLAARFPSVPNYGDVTTTDWSQVEPVDWLTAGYPCQPFSHAGKRKGSADERHLWPFVAAAIGALRPRRVLLENVAGHVSLGLDAVLWDLAALGYDATWGVVRAADAGAPHGRARIFIVAADTRSQRHGGGQDSRSLGRVDRQDASEARQRERSRPVAGDRDGAASSHPACQGQERYEGSGGQGGWAEPARCPSPHGDTPVGSLTDEQVRGNPAGQPERPLVGAVHRDRPGAATAGVSDVGRAPAVLAWGKYERAIRRWERITGRLAPSPDGDGYPLFVEWMQGLPSGWVTDILPRNPALKCLGNGVVPQQAALAVRTLLSLESRVAA